MNGIGGFVREARRRRVFRSAGLFIVAAWVVLQVADLAFQSLGIPGETLRFVWIAAAICLPLALIFGWRYDITPDGIRRTPPLDPARAEDLSLKGTDYLVLSLLAAIMVLVGFGVGTRILLDEPVEVVDVPSLAVLPFANLTGNPENDLFSDGLTEEIIGLLANVPGLKVAPRSSSRIFKSTEYTIPGVASQLSVEFALEGSVLIQDDQVRVTASLIDARTETDLWTDTYDRSLQDIIAIQGEIAGDVVDALEVVISRHSRERLTKPYTADLDAFVSYLRGRELLRKPKSDANFQAAVEKFDDAVNMDPEFAEAYAGLCEARLGQYELSRATSFFEKAESTCLRALTRDNEGAETHLALATLHFFSGQYQQADKEFKYVLTLNPTLVDARLGLARTYSALDRVDEAETEFQRAIRENPGYWDCYQLYGNFLIKRSRYQEAAANYQDAIFQSEDNVNAYNNLGAAYFLGGEFENAAEAFHHSLELKPSRGAYGNSGTMYYYSGDFDTAAQMYRQALKIAEEDPRVWSNLGDALQHAGAGTAEEAQEAYRKALALTEVMIKINPNDADAMRIFAYASAQLGDLAQADETLDRLFTLDPENMYVYYYAALIYEMQGRRDDAYAALQRALELGYRPALLNADPGFESLRREGRFKALLVGDYG